MCQQQNPTKHSHSDLEEFKKNWMQRIKAIAKDKTQAMNDFKEIYSDDRNQKSKQQKEILTVSVFNSNTKIKSKNNADTKI